MINNVVLLFSVTNEETPWEQLLQHRKLPNCLRLPFVFPEKNVRVQSSLGEQPLIKYSFQEIVAKQFRI